MATGTTKRSRKRNAGVDARAPKSGAHTDGVIGPGGVVKDFDRSNCFLESGYAKRQHEARQHSAYEGMTPEQVMAETTAAADRAEAEKREALRRDLEIASERGDTGERLGFSLGFGAGFGAGPPGASVPALHNVTLEIGRIGERVDLLEERTPSRVAALMREGALAALSAFIGASVAIASMGIA